MRAATWLIVVAPWLFACRGDDASEDTDGEDTDDTDGEDTDDEVTFGAPQVLVGGLVEPTALVADADRLYWADDDGIGSAALDGSAPVRLWSGDVDATALAVDDDFVYFVGDERIRRVGKAGGTATALADATAFVEYLVIDSTRVWWSDSDRDVIASVAKSGGAVTTLLDGLRDPSGLAIDSSRVYFATGADGTIHSATLDGTDVQVLAYGQEYPNSLILDGESVYWTTERTVMSLPATGGTPTSLAPSHRSYPQWLVTDASHLYYANSDDGSVERVPKAGGEMQVVVSDQGTTEGIVVQERTLFFASNGIGIVGRVDW